MWKNIDQYTELPLCLLNILKYNLYIPLVDFGFPISADTVFVLLLSVTHISCDTSEHTLTCST